jgi:hypothetical protein
MVEAGRSGMELNEPQSPSHTSRTLPVRPSRVLATTISVMPLSL